MSQSMPVGPALEQLREVIAILRELGNAGPRNQSFKQWRQVTMTLLQRIWPGDQTRAGRFRRIPFSPPSARADAKTIRECYERGVCEAIAFLEGLVLELENGAGKPGQKFVRPPEAPLRTVEERLETASSPDAVSAPPTPAAPTPAPKPMEAGPIEPSPWNGPTAPVPAASASASTPATEPASEPPPPVHPAEPARAAQPGADVAKGAGRSRQRLKDMLGFSDEAPESATAASPPGASPRIEPHPSAPAPPLAAQPPTPVAPPPPPAPAAAELPAAPVAPVIPFPSVTVRDGASGTRAASVPPEPVADSGDEEFDPAFDLMEEMGAEAGPPPATLREMLDRNPAPRPATPSSAALAVRAMAGKVDQLGVPPGRRAMVRATLVDLGRQLEAPPVEWAAIRQAFAFVMDYPQVARRIIPLLLPYLDEAA